MKVKLTVSLNPIRWALPELLRELITEAYAVLPAHLLYRALITLKVTRALTCDRAPERLSHLRLTYREIFTRYTHHLEGYSLQSVHFDLKLDLLTLISTKEPTLLNRDHLTLYSE